jgi:hypothetical protein
MTNILLYIPPIYKVSGGLGNFKLFFDICKKLNYKIYFCPILKNIESLNFISIFNNRSINSISHQELIDYYQLYTDQECETILKNDIVTPTILQARNNVIIYAEDVVGNPAEQKYVVRMLYYFPVPSAVASYNFNTDFICFYSDYIYNLYKYVCMACGIEDLLTKKIKLVNICRVFKFEPEVYKLIQRKSILNKNMNINKKCFTVRKLFPPVSFSSYNKGRNASYATEIFNIHQQKISNIVKTIKETDNLFTKKEMTTKLITLQNNPPDVKSDAVIREYLTTKFTNYGYHHVEHKTSSKAFIDYFLDKDFFLSFDPFTFMSIIASLCGCVSVVKKISIISCEEWMKCDPFLKYGIAYGNEGIEHALNTQHLLLDHITNMYLENEGNILNSIKKIENHFNIEI